MKVQSVFKKSLYFIHNDYLNCCCQGNISRLPWERKRDIFSGRVMVNRSLKRVELCSYLFIARVIMIGLINVINID